MLGSFGLIIGLPALLFAMFGWSQTAAHPLFGGYTQYMCAFGGLGATISGSLMLKEGFQIKKSFAEPVKEPTLECLVGLEREEEQTAPC
jgi:hypothetical protein